MAIQFGLLDPNAPAKVAASIGGGIQQSQQLMNQIRQNKLAEMKMKAYETKQANALARQQALQGATSTEEAANRLLQIGDYSGAANLQKMSAATKASEAAMQSQQATTLNTRLKTMRDQLAGANSPQAAKNIIAASYQDPVLGQLLGHGGSMQDALNEVPSDPSEFGKWKASSINDAKNLHDAVMQQQRDAAAMARTQATQAGAMGREIYKQTGAMPSDLAGTIPGVGGGMPPPPTPPEGGVSGLTPAQQRELQFATAKEQAKQQSKLQAALPEIKARKQEVVQQMESLKKEISDLREHPGLEYVTGARLGTETGKKTSALISQDAANAKALQDTIQGKIFTTVISQLKSLSATGATGLGALSNKEGDKLQNSYANLISTQDTDTYKKRLRDFESQVNKSIDVIKKHNLDLESKAFGKATEKVSPSTSQTGFLGFEQ